MMSAEEEKKENVPFKPIRKSAFMNYKKCPKKFWFSYFVHPEEYWNYNEKAGENEAAAKGDIFHAEVDDFFTRIDFELVYELTDQAKVFEYFRNNFSYSETYDTKKTDMDNWFDWFCEIEVKRLLFFKNNYNKSEFLEYYPPKHTEWKVSMKDDIDRTGHIDRIDYLPKEKSYAVVEYKTGKSYDPSKPTNLSSMRAECGFYAIILNEMKLLDHPVQHWILYNPRLKIYYVEKFPAATMRAVNNTFKGLVQKVKEAGDFARNITPLCMWCDYRRECFHGIEGEDKKYLFPNLIPLGNDYIGLEEIEDYHDT